MSWKTVKTPPDSDRPVLVWIGGFVPCIAKYQDGQWGSVAVNGFFHRQERITHWHPLPRAPKP